MVVCACDRGGERGGFRVEVEMAKIGDRQLRATAPIPAVLVG
jgi:hypothetical protein